MGWAVKYHPVRGEVFGGASADPGGDFASEAAPRHRRQARAAPRVCWRAQVPGPGRGGGEGDCRRGCLVRGGSRVVGRRLCVAIFEGAKGFYRGGLCVRM